MEEPAPAATVVVPEKAFILESAAVSHIEMVSTPRKHSMVQQRRPLAQAPQIPVTITWEMSPRLNRFERVA
jgi:hypothetical protein